VCRLVASKTASPPSANNLSAFDFSANNLLTQICLPQTQFARLVGKKMGGKKMTDKKMGLKKSKRGRLRQLVSFVITCHESHESTRIPSHLSLINFV